MDGEFAKISNAKLNLAVRNFAYILPVFENFQCQKFWCECQQLTKITRCMVLHVGNAHVGVMRYIYYHCKLQYVCDGHCMCICMYM